MVDEEQGNAKENDLLCWWRNRLILRVVVKEQRNALQDGMMIPLVPNSP